MHTYVRRRSVANQLVDSRVIDLRYLVIYVVWNGASSCDIDRLYRKRRIVIGDAQHGPEWTNTITYVNRRIIGASCNIDNMHTHATYCQRLKAVSNCSAGMQAATTTKFLR
jgi:hypothetical protein